MLEALPLTATSTVTNVPWRHLFPPDMDEHPTLDRNQGYGCFYFLPYPADHDEPPFDSTPSLAQVSVKSGNVQASASPFFQLPLEIQRIIYRSVLESMIDGPCDDIVSNTSVDGIRFVVCDPNYKRDYAVDTARVQPDIVLSGDPGSVEAHPVLVSSLLTEASELPPDEDSDWGDEDTSDDESDFSDMEDEEASTAHLAEGYEESLSHVLCNPSFGQPFLDVSIPFLRGRPPCWCEESRARLQHGAVKHNGRYSQRTHADYEAIRVLSQVPRQFARELGHVLWQNATVEFEEPHAFFLLFKERPAVLPLVKHVILHLDFYSRSLDERTPFVRSICEFVSERMTLRSFSVQAHFDELYGTREQSLEASGEYAHEEDVERFRRKEASWKAWLARFRYDVRAETYAPCRTGDAILVPASGILAHRMSLRRACGRILRKTACLQFTRHVCAKNRRCDVVWERYKKAVLIEMW